jgi:hypothetical protein
MIVTISVIGYTANAINAAYTSTTNKEFQKE